MARLIPFTEQNSDATDQERCEILLEEPLELERQAADFHNIRYTERIGEKGHPVYVVQGPLSASLADVFCKKINEWVSGCLMTQTLSQAEGYLRD